jgi:hypothetical protein
MNRPLAHPFFSLINCHSVYFSIFHNLWLQKAGHRPLLFFGTFCKLRVTAEHVPRALHMREYTYWLHPSLFLIIFSMLGCCPVRGVICNVKKNHISLFCLVLDRPDGIVRGSWRENCHFNYGGYNSCL